MRDTDSQFAGCRVAVLGAASGIGRATARAFAARAARVAVLDIDAGGLDALADELGSLGATETLAVAANVREPASCQAAMSRVGADLGGLDHLVFTSGILRVGPLMEMPQDEFDDVFAVNTRGFIVAARAALPLLQGGEPRRRSVTALSSAAAIRPKASSGAYAASKAALSHLVRVLAVELAHTGITVNAIAPATVRTPMTAPFMGQLDGGEQPASNHGYRLSGTSPMGRIAEPEDIAETCVFLSSAAAAYITGVTLPVDGGSTAAMPRT